MELIGEIKSIVRIPVSIYSSAKKCYNVAKDCEKNLDELGDQIKQLARELKAVKDLVNEAESYKRVADEDVKQWLDDEGKWIKGVEERLEHDRKRAKEYLFFKWCPNVMKRHKLSKKAVNEKSDVEDLIKKASNYKTIRRVSKRPQPGATQQVDPSNNEPIPSRETIIEAVVDALEAPDINKVGVYGMGGAGKTVLAEAVAKRVKEAKLFDAVIMCPLPRKPSIWEIQRMIFYQLEVEGPVEKKESVVTRLLHSLKKKNYLVVLDNLWTVIELRDVGIPIWDQGKGCKVLMTSRELNILSENGMRCQETIPVPRLSQKEAKQLFKRMAGYTSEDEEDLERMAGEIVHDCGALPVSVVAAAKGLKRRSLDVWKSARREAMGDTMKEEEHLCIETSYKLQESKELQSAFVLCSQMADNCTVRDLLKFAIVLDVFDEFHSVEEAQAEVRSYVLKLREASLLLRTGSSEQIVMHDVVRRVGQSIALRDHEAYTWSQEAEPKRWGPKVLKRVCLYCPIVTLRRELNYPELEFLVIEGKDRLLEAGQDFNLKAEKLKVLALYRCSFSSLPSFEGLNCLATLCLDGSKLGGANIDTIEKLQNLEILSFVESDIRSLPEKLGELSKLRILDLSDCSKLEMIPPNVISRLTSLEELYMGNSFSKWENEGEGQSTASLAELKKLSHLTNLEIHIPDAGKMPEDLFPGKLKRYRVAIGTQSGLGRFHYRGNITPWHSQNTEPEIAGKQDPKQLPKEREFELDGMRRLLKLKLDTSILEESYGVRKLVGRAEVLHLEELGGVENDLYDLDGEGFPELKHLNVSSNSKIKYMVNARKCTSSSFPQLETLILQELDSLEEICHGSLRARSLCNLKDLQVEGCCALKNLLYITTAQKPLNLRSITVKKCKSLKEIVAVEGAYSNQDKQAYENAFSELRRLDLRELPGLRNFYSVKKKQSEEISSADEQMTLFNGKIILSKLEVLTLHSAGNITRVWDVSQEATVSSFKNLTTLTVEKCHKLKYLFTSSMVSSLEQLQELFVKDCKEMEGIIVEEERSGEGESKEMKLLKLSTLLLENLQKLERFSTGWPIKFPVLKRLIIKSCKGLKTFNSKSGIAGQKRSLLEFSLLKCCHTRLPPKENPQPFFDEMVSFPGLEEMELFDMSNVEIWHKEFPNNSFCNLKKLTVRDCGNLQRVFPSNTVERIKRLDKLEITHCNSLVEIFELPGKVKPRESCTTGENQKGNKEELFQLRLISLRNLETLKSIWNKDPMGAIILKNLQSVEAVRCPQLKYIFPFSIAEKLEKLEELKITDCKEIKHVIGGKESVENPKVDGKVSKGAGRKTQKEGDGKISKEDRGKVVKEGDGKVSKEASKEAGGKVAKEGDDGKVSKEASKEAGGKLGGNAAKEGDGKFSKEAGGKFSKAVDGKVANDANVEVAPDFWFPNLTSMTLSNLSDLGSLYPGKCNLECPSLQELELKDCGGVKFPKLADLILGPQSHTEIAELLSSGGKVTEVSDAKSDDVPLEGKIKGKEVKDDSKFGNKDTHVSTSDFPVETLTMEEFESDVPINFYPKFLNLEKLVVRHSPFEVLFSYEGKLRRIRNLEISSVPELLHIWEEDYRLDPFLQYLEKLDVQNCPRIRELLPFSASFKNLMSLEVRVCNSLRFIMRSSTARSLVQLKRLTVQNCSLVETIVAYQEDDMDDPIIFSRLEHLGLVDLPKLQSFSKESYTFIFPSMNEAIVARCPGMEFFSKGLLKTPKLDGEKFKGDSVDKLMWTGDLNSTIQRSFMELHSSARDSGTTFNNKVTEVRDAESDDVLS